MAIGVKALRKIQIGQEAVAGGTTDPASTIWRGTGVLKDNTVVAFPAEDVAVLGGTTRSYIARAGGEISLEGDATYQQLPYLFNGAFNIATPTTDTGSGTGYIRSWSSAIASTDYIATTDIQTFVIEGGDNNECEVMRYAFVRELNISGTMGEALQVTALLEGRQVAGAQTYTASVAIPTVESILVSKALIYIDPTSDTIGTTVKSNTLLGIDMNIKTGWIPVFAADNRIDFSMLKRADDEATLKLTFEHDSTASAEKVAWRAQTERGIRIVFFGTALTAAGAHTYFTFRFDAYGLWETFDVLGETDGNDTVTGNFKIRYSPTAGKKLDVLVVNQSATLT